MIAPNIYIDRFNLRPKSEELKYAYFLTHWHSDHYQGITHGWSFGPIFCSQITKRILLTKFPKLDQKVQGLRMNVWYEYHQEQQKCEQLLQQEFEVKSKLTKGVFLMLFDANHIAGSVMYIFINRQINKTYFHTGDMRFNIKVVQNTPKLYEIIRKDSTEKFAGTEYIYENKEKKQQIKERYSQKTDYCCKFRIDELHLDNTYCDPIFDFPPRSKAMKMISQIIELNKGKRILLCTDTIGKEEAFVVLSEKYRTSVILNQERYQYCKAMGIIQPIKKQTGFFQGKMKRISGIDCHEKMNFSLNPQDGWIQVIRKSEKQERIKKNSNCIAITMTGWANINDYQETGYNQYIVPYSLHSNFKQLQLFMELMRPRKLIPIVKEREGKSQKFRQKIGSYESYMRSLTYMKQRGLDYFQKEYCG